MVKWMIWPFLALAVIGNVQAGMLGGLMLSGNETCTRGPNGATYTSTSYGCFGFSLAPTTWEYARDRCRDDGGTLAIFSKWDELRTVQIRMSSLLNQTNTSFCYTGINEGGFRNLSAGPESVPYDARTLYDNPPMLLSDNDPNRSLYRCGVTPHADWTNGGQSPSNNASMKDPITGMIWPYAPSPYMFKCPKDAYDTYLQSFVCRLPGLSDQATCICTKWKEPGVRNFKGDYFTVLDQTEYIMVQTSTYTISILLWQNNIARPQQFPNLKLYVPDKGLPVKQVKVEYGGKFYDMVMGPRDTCTAKPSLSVNAVPCTYTLNDPEMAIDGLIARTITSGWGWAVLALLMPDGTRIMYDGSNVEIMTVNSVGNSMMSGLCGTCNPNVLGGNPLPDGRLTARKTLLSSSWISPRTRFSSQPPAIETCGSETHKRYAGQRCRYLIDTSDGYTGQCLTNNPTARTYGNIAYRKCMARVCSHGPAAACTYFKGLNGYCNNSLNMSALQCATTNPCPLDMPYYEPSPGGICYHVGRREMYWDQAYLYCHSIGAQLVSFSNADESEFIKCKIAKPLSTNITDPAKQFLWLGGVRDDLDQRHWTDGTSTSYNLWETDGSEDSLARCATYELVKGNWIMKSCESDMFRPFCYVYSTTNYTCSDQPCPPPKVCIDGACMLAPEKVNACDPNPCQNGGQCFTQPYFGSGFMCMCQEGYYRSRCHRKFDGTTTKPFPSLDATQFNPFSVVPARRYPPSACWKNGTKADYLVVSDPPLDWELAREKCRSYGGRLNSLDLDEDKTFFPSTPAYSAYYRASASKPALMYMKDGGDYNTSLVFPSPGCLLWASGSCPADNGNPMCSLATSAGASAPITCSVSDGAARKPYVCKRPADRCLCSKSLEPVFRTFNGEDIPLEDDAAYTIFASDKFTVMIALHDPASLLDIYNTAKFPAGTYYYPDKWPVVSRVSVILQGANTSITCELRVTLSELGFDIDHSTKPGRIIQQVCNPSLPAGVTITKVSQEQYVGALIPHTYRFDAVASYGFEFVFDGSNMELAVNYSIAASVKPGNGLCGVCDDQLRDTLFSKSHLMLENKRVAARNYLVSNDVWPASSRRIPTCTSEAHLRAATRLCYSLYKEYAPDLAEATVNLYHRTCIKNVCQFGPIGACAISSFINTNLTFCGKQPGACFYQNTLYSNTQNGDQFCQYQAGDAANYYQLNYYDMMTECVRRGYSLASMDPTIFNHVRNGGLFAFWAGAVADIDYEIPFWLRGLDVTPADRDMSSDVWSGNSPCVNSGRLGLPYGVWDNNLACAEVRHGLCSATSGKCNNMTCLPPSSCISGNCTQPAVKTVWPVY